MLRTLRASLLIAALACLASCSGPVSPRPAFEPMDVDRDEATLGRNDGRLFYPLDLGNRWRYDKTLSIFPAGGSTFTPIVRRSSVEHEHVCVEPMGGREYVVDRVTQVDSLPTGNLTYVQWIRARQDPTGLYEADLDLGTAPSCAGDGAALVSVPPDERNLLEAWRSSAARADVGALERASLQVAMRLAAIREVVGAGRGSLVAAGELTRLRYPMKVGNRWIVRTDPMFSTTVEALEFLETPAGTMPAYRLRMNPPVLGPHDRILFWYGRMGMVGMRVHIEIPTDVGVLIAEDVLVLEDLSVARGRF